MEGKEEEGEKEEDEKEEDEKEEDEQEEGEEMEGKEKGPTYFIRTAASSSKPIKFSPSSCNKCHVYLKVSTISYRLHRHQHKRANIHL